MTQPDNSSSGKLKLVPSTKRPAIVKSPRPVSRKILPVTEQNTLIEKYSLDQMCWRLFWTTTQNIDELTLILNNNLVQKESALKSQSLLHPNQRLSRLTAHDTISFLNKYKDKIEKVIDGREEQMKEVTFDIIDQIQRTAVNVMETMELWQAKLGDARGKDDLKEMMLTSKMLSAERKSLVEYLKQLAELTGKVKTHISVSVLQENIQIICQIIAHSEMLDENQKLALLSQVQQSVTITVSKSVDD